MFLNVRRVLVCATLLVPAAIAQQYSDQYALILNDEPVAARFIGRGAHLTAAAGAYRRQIETAQQAVRSQALSRKVQITGSSDTILNAVFVQARPEQLADLQSIPGVKGVVRMRVAQQSLNRAITLMNGPAAWTSVGGQSTAGAGMKIAVIDSGIDQTHPAFQDSSLTAPAGFPKFTDGHPEDKAYTTNKVIVARSYVRQIAPGSDPANPAANSRPDDYSPRDRDGHGTAVASAAAANSTIAPSATTTGSAVTITGMAPKAFLGNYKVSGSPGVNDNPPESVIILAANDAVKDGMDVISISLGFPAIYGPLDTGAACGLAAGVPCDPLGQAFENAVKAGVVVVAAAGNNGGDGLQYPTFGTVGTPANSPNVIAVGASSNSHYFNQSFRVDGGPANLQNLVTEITDTYSCSPFGAASAAIVDVATLNNDGLACSALPPGSLSNAFALIKRGTCNFSVKEGNALDAGAIGVIFYNNDASTLPSPTGMSGCEPAAVVSLADGNSLTSYLATHAGATGTIDPTGNEVDDANYQNQLAWFSAVGPALDGTIKPDLVAAGSGSSSYNGMYLATQNYDTNSALFSTSRYIGAAGTSFSAPIVAGAAALVKQKHPTWTPAQIKSALVNTASQSVTTDDGAINPSFDPVDVQWLGAGRLDAGAAVNASVLASPTSLSYGVLAAAPSNLSKQITLTNSGSAAVTLTAAVAPGTKSLTGNLTAGLNPTLDKTSLALAPGASGTVTVTLNGALPSAGSFSGAVTFQATGVSLRVPYLYLIGSGKAYNVWALPANVEGVVGQPVINDLSTGKSSNIAVLVTDAAGVPVANAPVIWSSTPRRAITFNSATTTTTNAVGIATADITISATGSFTINVTAGGLVTSFDPTANCNCFGRVQPTIATGGVASTANFQGTIAPGSYISIFGSALSDPGFIDSNTQTTLPLVIDGVTVSFDVPSAGISYPGRIVFVSPGQVNVQAPWELQGQNSAQVKVTIDSYSFGNVVSVPVADAVPEFFVDTTSGVVAARDTTASANQIFLTKPAVRGQPVSLYLNGLGPVDNQPATGEPARLSPLSNTRSTPIVMVGNQQAQVLFSGLAPGFPALYQINIVVPSGLSAGSQPITVSIGGKTSPAKLPGATGAAIVLPVQ